MHRLLAKINIHSRLLKHGTIALTASAILANSSINSYAQNRDVIDSLPNLGSSSAQYLSKQQSSILGAACVRSRAAILRFLQKPREYGLFRREACPEYQTSSLPIYGLLTALAWLRSIFFEVHGCSTACADWHGALDR